MGVVGVGFEPGEPEEVAMDSAEGWMFSTSAGGLAHDANFAEWPGQPGRGEVRDGDVIGLLLDLGAIGRRFWTLVWTYCGPLFTLVKLVWTYCGPVFDSFGLIL